MVGLVLVVRDSKIKETLLEFLRGHISVKDAGKYINTTMHYHKCYNGDMYRTVGKRALYRKRHRGFLKKMTSELDFER